MSSFHKHAKDLRRCLRNLESFTDGQASINNWDETSLTWINMSITPNDGPYKNARYNFIITFPDGYPEASPEVNCTTSIYHPNIDDTANDNNVCLSLFDEWQATFGIEDCVQGLLFLLYNPNIEDPLSPHFGSDMLEEEYLENVCISLTGEEIEGTTFAKNNIEDDDNTAEELEEGLVVKLDVLVQRSEAEDENTEETDADVESENRNNTENTELSEEKIEDLAGAACIKDLEGHVDENKDPVQKTSDEPKHTDGAIYEPRVFKLEPQLSTGSMNDYDKDYPSVSTCLPSHLDPLLSVASLGIYYLCKALYNRFHHSRSALVPHTR